MASPANGKGRCRIGRDSYSTEITVSVSVASAVKHMPTGSMFLIFAVPPVGAAEHRSPFAMKRASV